MLKDFFCHRDVGKQHELLHQRICLPGNKEVKAKLNTRRVDERVLGPSGQNTYFEQLDWKRLVTQRQIQEAVMVYKSLHGLAPNYLSSLFNQRNISYNLRDNENKLVIPLPRTNFLKNSFRYYGAVIWNSLPLELQQPETINSFRRRCHNFFT